MRHAIAAAILILAGAAEARDVALVVGLEDYEALPEVPAGNDVTTLVEALRDAGFEVIAQTDADHEAIREGVGTFVERAAGADRLLVVLNGHFLRTDRERFLLPVDRGEPGLAELPRRALPVSLLSSVLDDLPAGRAVMVLGGSGWDGQSSPFVERGLGEAPADPGHVLIEGGADAAGAFARGVLAVPGQSFGPDDVRAGDLSAVGLSEPLTFLPGEEPGPEDGAGEAERDYWETVRGLDTEEGYVAYLDRFPAGAYAEEAARQLDAVRREADRRARAGEEALGLAVEDRRRVQEALSALGFDPRGVDGVLGPGTRAALRAWQAAQGVEETGYLTADQLSELAAQAGQRAAEVEAEADRGRQQARRDERAYWEEVGRGGGTEGLRAYLDRYPEGRFAERARERLTALEGEGAATADARAWEEARAADDPAAYRRYLEAFPEGARAEEARARSAPSPDEAAAAAEEALGLSTITRSLVEQRLDSFGFEPGDVDGRFDDETRRALRRYQRSRNLEPTGYLDQAVVARLLADSILR